MAHPDHIVIYLCIADIGIYFVERDDLPSGNGSIGSTTVDGMLSALASLILREGSEGSEAAWTPASQRTASLAAFTPGFRSRAMMMGEAKWEDERVSRCRRRKLPYGPQWPVLAGWPQASAL